MMSHMEKTRDVQFQCFNSLTVLQQERDHFSGFNKFAMNRITDASHVNRPNCTSHAGILDGLGELLICFVLPLNSSNKHS